MEVNATRLEKVQSLDSSAFRQFVLFYIMETYLMIQHSNYIRSKVVEAFQRHQRYF